MRNSSRREQNHVKTLQNAKFHQNRGNFIFWALHSLFLCFLSIPFQIKPRWTSTYLLQDLHRKNENSAIFWRCQQKCEIKKCHHYQPIFTKIAIKTERKELRSWFCPYFFAFIVLFPVIYNTYSIDLFLEISKWWRHFDDVITRSCDPPIFFFHTQLLPRYI